MEEPDWKAVAEQVALDAHRIASLLVLRAVPGEMSPEGAAQMADMVEQMGRDLEPLKVDQAHFRICAQHLRDYARGRPED